MSIFECSPFLNENLVFQLKYQELADYIDQFTIVEADKNFSYSNKVKNFEGENFPKVKYEYLNVKDSFVREGSAKHFLRRIVAKFSKDDYVKTIYGSGKWHNEAFQRNVIVESLDFKDDDIIILSDVDEIIDSRHFENILDLVKKHEIITIKLYFTLFFLNLFSAEWGGPPDYSYRVFIMTGKKWKALKMSSDKLRKLGERGFLLNEIFCPNDILGFHHSWLGDEKFVANKLISYCHSVSDHESNVFLDDGTVNIEQVKEMIKNKKSLFPGHKLISKPEVKMLRAVEMNPQQYKMYLI